MAEYYYAFKKKYERTGKIFSGRKASSSSIAATELHELNRALLRAGLEPVRAEGRSTKAYQEAQQKAREALEEEERRKERERLREEAEQKQRVETRREKFDRVTMELEEADKYHYMAVLREILTPEEQELLKGYSSDEIVQIAEIFIDNEDLTMEEAIEKYHAQQQTAFEDMANGEDDDALDDWPF